MKTIQEIIQETYNTKPSFKEHVGLNNLSLDNVGVIIYSKHPMNPKTTILDLHKSNSPIVLNFSKEDNQVISQSVCVKTI